MVPRGPSTPLRSAQNDLRYGDDQPPKNGALFESVLMMFLRRERVSRITSRLATAPLAFVNSRVCHDRGGFVGGIESRIGRARQVMRIFVEGHGASAWDFRAGLDFLENRRAFIATDSAVGRENP
jgi:hypothetical protein